MNTAHKLYEILRLPFGKGRFLWTPDPGHAIRPADLFFGSHLGATHMRNGKIYDKYDLGSGLITNIGVLALANDFAWASPSAAAINTFKLANWHASGKGATGAAATDFKIQTISTNGGQTPVAGAQTLVTTTFAIYKTVATITYTGSEAVNEWALFTSNTLSASTGTPFTAGAATTGTVTGTPLTASSTTVQGQQQNIFVDTTAATNFWGLVLSNSTSVVTVPAWYKVTDGTVSGVNPVNADVLEIRPVMWDHKVFAGAINVQNLDQIQFTYSLTITPGT